MASLFSSVLLSLCLLCSPFLSNANAKPKLGFTADLIHRDSPKSPFYNPAETPSQRLRNAIHRSVNRVFHFTEDVSLNSPQTEITSNGGEYLMNVSLGTPPFPIMAIADTGSDLLWTQCKPCDDCYTQDDPLFDPTASSTYKDVACSSSQCSALENQASCSTDGSTCSYSMSYGDHSYTKGNVAADTLTLGSTDNRPVQLKNVIIGCGHNNAGTFNEKGSGIIGLGGGAVSLVTQLGDSINGKFSYCLVPFSSETDKTSKINFGTNADVSGTGVVSTPLITKSPETFYYLTLEAISVGSKKLPFQGSDSGRGEGNIIIDSGTTMTLLPTEFYKELEDAVASSIDAERQKDPQGGLSLCYSATSDLKVPVITMHFDGADVKLDSSNIFVQISQDLVCFAFRASPSLSIYGNLSQMNFLVGYDTVSKKVSFMPTDCAKM
ncbi:PREDICTED: aspartic proteinase CDR1-like [Camelina sativa]|uniref:Aspartic proteinase CDR1-like n=1 Tax=Camelina sativa TaxID=90675 RepID=A0ABM0U3T7_CAMSA|nr:PREDICTED: aspartic proteinase CDR1-like [Camelina sativa]